jgi:predicted GNAT family acetyltransferase
MRHHTPARQPEKIVHTGLVVEHDADRCRYALWHQGTYIGFVGYSVGEDGVITLQHTIINEAYGRRGYARALVTMVLDELREAGRKIVPECTYVQDYLRRYPEYRDMVAG